MSQYLDSNHYVGAVGANLFDNELKPTRSFRRRRPDNLWLLDHLLFNGSIEKLKYRDCMIFNPTSKIIDVAYIVGADLMVKRDILNRIGGFNPEFFMYYEEIELCDRISNYGYQIKNIPVAKIQHLQGKSTPNNTFRAQEMSKSIYNYFKITKGKASFIISRILYLLLSLERYIIYSIFSNKYKKEYWRIQIKSFIK